jgi:hypothetical protein
MAKRASRSAKKQRRGGRDAKTFARRGPTREPYDVVLIVCEGSKTEPNYLAGLRTAYSLSNANIKILHGGATDPKSIVEFALAEMGREGYDRAFCVFDRDGHQTFDEALGIISGSAEGRANRLVAITSWPCFEIWLLLHFTYSAAPYTATGSRSAGDRVLAEVLKHLADYQKGQKGLFEALAPRLDDAMTNASRLETQNKITGTNNPHTRMHHLIKYLTTLKKK